jgi:hypothetical protein
MSFVITSDTSKQYLLEEDAVKGFEIAVGNGQVRLALTILVDVINGFMEVFNSFDEDTEEETTLVNQPETKVVKEEIVAPKESPVAKDEPAAKAAPKKEVKTTEEK